MHKWNEYPTPSFNEIMVLEAIEDQQQAKKYKLLCYLLSCKCFELTWFTMHDCFRYKSNTFRTLHNEVLFIYAHVAR